MYFKKSFGPNLQIVCLKDCVWSWCMYIYYTYTCLFWCSTFWWHNSRNLQCFISELLEMTAKPGPAEIYWNSFRSSKFGKLSKLGRFSETLCRFAVNVWANWTEPIGYLSVFDTIHSEHNIISDTPWSNLGKYEDQEISQGPREMYFPMRPFVACCSVFSGSTIQGTICEKSNDTRLKEVFYVFFPRDFVTNT